MPRNKPTQPPTTETFNPAWPFAGSYRRKSSVFGEEDRTSTERQLTGLSSCAKGIQRNVVHFQDAEGHRSGRFVRTRPGYMEFKRRILTLEFDTLIFYRLDRANRSIKETIWLVEFCKENNIRLILIRDNFDSHSDGWKSRVIRRLYEQALRNEFEAEDVADRMRDAIEDIMGEGVYWGTTPKGLVRVGMGVRAELKRRALRHDPELARRLPHKEIDNTFEDIRLLVLLWSQRSYNVTAQELNRRGVRYYNRAGMPEQWDEARVRQVIGNVLVYCGYLIPKAGWAKARAVKFEGEGSLLQKLATAYHATRTTKIEPIFNPDDPEDAALIEKVIAKKHLAQNTFIRGRRVSGYPFLLTPLLYHGGQKLRAQLNNGFPTYATRISPRISWNAEEIDNRLMDRLRGVSFPDAARHQIQGILEKRMDKERLLQLRAEREVLAKQLDSMLQLLISGDMKRDDYHRERGRREARINEIDAELNNAAGVQTAMEQLTTLGETLDKLAAQQKRIALHTMFETVEINTEGEIIKIAPRQWAKRAFADVIWAVKHSHLHNSVIPKMTPTGVGIISGISLNNDTTWLVSLMAE